MLRYDVDIVSDSLELNWYYGVDNQFVTRSLGRIFCKRYQGLLSHHLVSHARIVMSLGVTCVWQTPGDKIWAGRFQAELAWCLSFLSVAVVTYSGKSNLREKGLLWSIVRGHSPSCLRTQSGSSLKHLVLYLQAGSRERWMHATAQPSFSV